MKRDAYLDDTDAALADAAQRYGRERYAFEARQRLPQERRRFDANAWREMAEMGWLSVATSEDDNGLGLRAGSIALLARAAGAARINEPLASTGFVGADILRLNATPAQRSAWLPRLVEGKLRLACAFAGRQGSVRAEGGRLQGRLEVVPDADLADLLLVEVEAGTSVRWYAVAANASRLRRTPYPLMDGRAAATLEMDGCEGEPLAPSANLHSRLVAALATAADALGAMEVAFGLTLDYVKTRKQFGITLGSHQVVAHRAVDMLIRLEECRAVVAGATRALESEDPARAYEVHAAKAYVCPQARLLAQEAVQLHGGIGITEEYAVSHCLRRILVDEQLYGSTREHLRAFAASPKGR
jgi:alkylation response protein AidB-like acyl-CoA dehydrogenase